jgi:hypothetical protein
MKKETTSGQQKPRSFARKSMYTVILVTLLALFIECASILFVHIRYHVYIEETLQYHGKSAALFLLKKVLPHNELSSHHGEYASPSSYRIPDSLHGYRNREGSFEITYTKRNFDTLQRFKFYVTIQPDGSRFVGTAPHPPTRHVYVFGDSFIFGDGVNDEQTFTYLLQSRFPNTQFHLYACSSYSLTNAFLNFRRLSSKIGPDDILVLGYASFFDIRHVAAPSRIRQWGSPAAKDANPSEFKHVRARLDGDSLAFDRIPLFCEFQPDYCKQADPPASYMNEVTLRLINGIATSTRAKIYLLHFSGQMNEHVRKGLDPKVRIVPATTDTYDYIMRDDINGFDGHPGPYWNHAIYRRLADTLKIAGVR